MKFTGVIDEDRQVMVPETVVRTLHLTPGSRIEIEISPAPTEDEKRQRSERLKAVLEQYQGSMREQMLADGYASVDELMNDIRPPW